MERFLSTLRVKIGTVYLAVAETVDADDLSHSSRPLRGNDQTVPAQPGDPTPTVLQPFQAAGIAVEFVPSRCSV